MKPCYVVVADAARARLFEFDRKAGQLEELQDFSHPESRLREREMDSDKPGSHAGGVSGSRHNINPREESARHEMEVFARQLSEFLESARVAGNYDTLILMAPPKFLGEFRKHLTDQCSKLVSATVDKELFSLTSEAILERLREL